MEPTARRDLQQQQQSSSGRRMKSFYADYKSTKELTSPSSTPSHPPSLPLLHYSDTLLSIWKFARLSGGQRQRQRRLRLDRIGTAVAVDGHRRKEIERKAGSQQLATGRVDKANFSSWAN